ncbi:hypothetical protein GCM10028808_18660 [Spirosoma migulaei]
MRLTILLLLLTAIVTVGCKNSQNFSELSKDDKNAIVEQLIHMPTGVLSATLTAPAARTMTTAYRDALNRMVTIEGLTLPDGSTGNIRMPLIEFLHHGTPKDGYPSYRIEADSIRNILGQSKKVDYLLIYPAMKPVKDPATSKDVPTFTLVLLGADSAKNPVLGGGPGGKDILYEYIDPCPPPIGCRNF